MTPEFKYDVVVTWIMHVKSAIFFFLIKMFVGKLYRHFFLCKRFWLLKIGGETNTKIKGKIVKEEAKIEANSRPYKKILNAIIVITERHVNYEVFYHLKKENKSKQKKDIMIIRSCYHRYYKKILSLFVMRILYVCCVC